QSEKQTRGDDHGPRVEAVQRWWKVKNLQSREHSERSHRGIDVQPGGKAGAGDNRKHLILVDRRDLHSSGKLKGRHTGGPSGTSIGYKVLSISNPHASRRGSGMYLLFLL